MRPGALQAIRDSINSEWTGAWLFRQYERDQHDPDPDFRGVLENESLRAQFTQGLDEDLWSGLAGAASMGEALKARQQLLSVQESRRRLSSLGWGGVALQVGASILDPANIAIGAVTGGAGIAVTRAGRMGRMVKAGFITAGSEVALEGYLASQDPQRGLSDVVLAAGGAFALGAGLHYAVDAVAFRNATRRLADDMAFSDLVGGSMGAAGAREFSPDFKATFRESVLSERGRLRFRDQIDPARRRQIADGLIEQAGLDAELDPETVAHLRGLDPEDVINAWGPRAEEANPYVGVPPRENIAGQGTPVVYHGTRTGNVAAFVDAKGNLVLKPSENFEGRQVGVSFTRDKATARDYATRVPGEGPVRSNAQGMIFEIDADAIPVTLRPEAEDELFASGSADIVIPRGKFRIQRDTASGSALAKWEQEQVERVGQLSDDSLVREYSSSMVRNEAAEGMDEGSFGTPSEGLSSDIVAKYGREAPNSFPVWDELVARVRASDNPEATARALMERVEAGNPVAGGPSDVKALVTAATTTRNPSLRPPSVDELDARAGQILQDNPDIDAKEARRLAEQEVAIEDAARARESGEPKAPKAPETAEAAPPPRPPKLATDFFPGGSGGKADRPWFMPRFDMSGMLGMSDSPMLRWFSEATAQSGILNKAKAPLADAGTEWSRRRLAGYLLDYYGVMDDARGKWLKENGYTAFSKSDGERVFNRAVGLAISSDDELARATPSVARVARHQAKVQADLLGMMQRHGVKGALRVDPNFNYLTRMWNTPEIDRVVSSIGIDKTYEAFGRAVEAANPEIESDLAFKIGRGLVKRLRDLEKWTDLEKARMFGRDQSDEVAALLKQEAPELSQDQVNELVYRLVKKDDESGLRPFLKRRTLLDENYTEPISLDDGTTFDFGIPNLIERDAEFLFRHYSRGAVGAAAEASILEAASKRLDPTGKTVVESFDQAKNMIAREMESLGMGRDVIDRDLSKLDTLWRHLKGMRTAGDIDPAGAVAKTLRTLRGLNYLRLSGGFGVAQMVEMGNLVGEAGFKVLAQQAPAIGSIFKGARYGNLDGELVDQLLSLGLAHSDTEIHRLLAHVGEYDTATERAVSGFERGTAQLSRAASTLSGFRAIDSGLRKMSAVFAVQKLANIAASGKMPSKARLAAYGPLANNPERVFEMAKKHLVTVDGVPGRRVKKIALEAWNAEDPQSLTKFIVAVDKWANRAIQTNDVGNLSKWMTFDLAKSLLQFRTFVLNAYVKQTLFKAQMRDWEAFSGMAYSSLLAALTYTGWQYAQSIGRKDADEYRKKFLTMDRIIAAGVSRSGWSSIAPAVADNLWSFTGGDPFFRFGRYSGLDVSGLTQNPTADLVNNVLKIGPALGNPVREAMGGEKDRFTQNDARAFTRLLPFQNVIGIKNILESLASRLPERESK